jgi:hypothetical protein
MTFNPQWIVGKTIASVEMNPFPRGLHEESRRGIAHNPVIWFTDGSRIEFSTEETEVGEYGTAISYAKARRAHKNADP